MGGPAAASDRLHESPRSLPPAAQLSVDLPAHIAIAHLAAAVPALLVAREGETLTLAHGPLK